MKNLIHSLLVMLSVGFGTSMAQNHAEIPLTGTETELIASYEISFPLPYWHRNWSKESLIQIQKLIEEYGNPDEITQSRMLWTLPGKIPKTIIFTEYFLYLPDSIPVNNNLCDTIRYSWH